MSNIKNIAFVCYANYCRSPVAENIMKSLVSDINVHSFGINPLNKASMDPRSIRYLKDELCISALHSPKKITKKFLNDFEIFYAMDYKILKSLRSSYPKFSNRFKLFNYMDREIVIQDPFIFKEYTEYKRVMDLILEITIKIKKDIE